MSGEAGEAPEDDERDRHLGELAERASRLLERVALETSFDGGRRLIRSCAQCLDAIDAARRLRFSWNMIGLLDDKVREVECEVRLRLVATVNGASPATEANG